MRCLLLWNVLWVFLAAFASAEVPSSLSGAEQNVREMLSIIFANSSDDVTGRYNASDQSDKLQLNFLTLLLERFAANLTEVQSTFRHFGIGHNGIEKYERLIYRDDFEREFYALLEKHFPVFKYELKMTLICTSVFLDSVEYLQKSNKSEWMEILKVERWDKVPESEWPRDVAFRLAKDFISWSHRDGIFSQIRQFTRQLHRGLVEINALFGRVLDSSDQHIASAEYCSRLDTIFVGLSKHYLIKCCEILAYMTDITSLQTTVSSLAFFEKFWQLLQDTLWQAVMEQELDIALQLWFQSAGKR